MEYQKNYNIHMRNGAAADTKNSASSDLKKSLSKVQQSKG